MITTQHTDRQFELHMKFSTVWLHWLGAMIAQAFDFSQVRAIQRQKEQTLRDFGHDDFKMN